MKKFYVMLLIAN